MKYGDKIIYMEGIIVELHDGSVAIDLKGRLGFLKVPMRMIINDHPLELGQEVGFNMSFVEVLSEKVNEEYFSNIEKRNQRIKEAK
ncbi:CBO2463/CBO2479 domain-containing protein [Gudongella sp. DL1XJH-153]|uniref:CBO2463/CBO2479 domain-containing protein n=1 Tax=Gudongella sp. DL1XJH-153 TaxID=3409804 RepID=UPI003BB64A9D